MGKVIQGFIEKEFSETIVLVGSVSRLVRATEAVALCSQADVLIDFSAPSQIPPLAAACAEAGCALVTGTTGLDTEGRQALLAASQKIPVLHESNFSLGIQIVAHLVAQAAILLGETVDIEILEKHHRYKADAPSGTALFLGEVLAQATNTSLQEKAEWPRLPYHEGTRTPGTLRFSCQRGGTVVGTHRVDFFAPDEILTIEHQAQDRRVFARGALQAALWIRARPPKTYKLADMLANRGL
jgi:4-hydroxy-tetrahydrodipicolinate reductase